MLKSKIHRATVTDCDLHYVGSITIDPDLLEAADIREHEQVHVVDVDNGARFETYTIAGERGSREMKVNGAAARLVHRGDTIIVISYASYDEAELDELRAARRPRDARQRDPRRRPRARHAPELRESAMSSHPNNMNVPDRRLAAADDAAAPGRAQGASASRVVMVTAYDFPSARAAEAAGVDLVLVGDSGAMTVLGYSSTVPVELDELLVLARAVRRGLRTPFWSATCRSAPTRCPTSRPSRPPCASSRRRAATRSSSRAAAQTSVARARAIVNAGIPVMGHVGLTPQTATALGGYKAQGRTAEAAARVAREALALQEAGCFSIVFEAIPAAVAEAIMPRMDAGDRHRRRPGDRRPGAGVPRPARHPRGPRRAVRQALRRRSRRRWTRGVAAFAEDVRERRYPAPEHTYSIDEAELEAFRAVSDLEGRLASWEALEGF